jgi:hypothetical protein
VTGVTVQQGNTYYFNYTSQGINRESGILITDALQVGRNQQNKTFNTIEVRFRNPLLSGDSVQVVARKYFGGAYTGNDFTSYTYNAQAGNTLISTSCPCVVQQNEEILIQLNTTCANVTTSGCPIKQIILR